VPEANVSAVPALLLFATPSYAYLQRAVAAAGGFAPGAVERRTFPDGEHYRRIVDDVRGRHVAILGGTISDTDTLAIYDLACGAAKDGARSLTLVFPYFGYATMERAMRDGEVVTAKTRARLFSSIPSAPDGNHVVLLDLHAEGVAHYFEGDVHPVHLSAKSVVKDAIRELGGTDFVLASTDAGRAKWVQALANDLGVEPSFVWKRRLTGDRTEVVATTAQVAGKIVVLYDDMIRTGGSLINAARAYKDAGAAKLSAVTTHGVFPGDALAKIRASGLFEAVVATDSHPRAVELEDGFLRVRSIAAVLAEELA
jgi:ribose-phosphate pyrophosphokinase